MPALTALVSSSCFPCQAGVASVHSYRCAGRQRGRRRSPMSRSLSGTFGAALCRTTRSSWRLRRYGSGTPCEARNRLAESVSSR